MQLCRYLEPITLQTTVIARALSRAWSMRMRMPKPHNGFFKITGTMKTSKRRVKWYSAAAYDEEMAKFKGKWKGETVLFISETSADT